MSKPKLLLHSCCGPCSSACLERLIEQFDVTVLYYNPGIEPTEEYYLRLENQKKIISSIPGGENISLIEGPYDPDSFHAFADSMADEPEGGKRCEACFRQRLSYTAQIADQMGFDYFTTTLTISPHKNAKLINEIGEALQEKAVWLHSDFKKQNGFLRSIELSKEYGLYRQDYCGCVFSVRGK